jgi:hypothetical protein
VPVPPAAIIQVSNLPGSDKKKLIQMLTQQSPEDQMTKQLTLQGLQFHNQERQSKAQLNMAKAQEAAQPHPENPQQPEFQIPPVLQMQDQMAKTQATRAQTVEKLARAHHLNQSAEQLAHTRQHDIRSADHQEAMDAHQRGLDVHDRGQQVAEMFLDAQQQERQHQLAQKQAQQRPRQFGI